jgi:RNase adapter protein RapZ
LPARRGTRRFIILTGLSGSGKTHAIRALEDLGYFCIDNLPTLLIPTMADLAGRDGAGLDKVAIVVDVREGGFLKQFPRTFRKLQATPGVEPKLIFLEASHSALVRRFSETDSRRARKAQRHSVDGRPDHRHVEPHGARAPRDLHAHVA